MKAKVLAAIVSFALAFAMVPSAAFAVVTDLDESSIKRETVTNYFTTVKLEVHLDTWDGQLLHSIEAPEVAGGIGDDVVKSRIKSMKEDGQAWSLENGYEPLGTMAERTDFVYANVYDEIKYTGIADYGPQPKASDYTVTIITHSDRHQTHTITQVVTNKLPNILPTFDANQESPEGTGEFQGLGYVAESGEEFVPVDGEATFVVNGATYAESELRGLLSTLRAGTVVEASYTFKATGEYARFQDSGSITITIVPSANSYEMIEGAGGIHKIGTTDALTFRSNAEFNLFNRVVVDGNIVDSSNYTASEGSTVVTLSASYLDTLKPGTHNIAIVSGEGPDAAFASAEFTIIEADKADSADKATSSDKADSADKATSSDKAATTTPQTGDGLPMVPLAVAAVSALALLAFGVRKINA